mmetsp:Transcript_9837/g.11363  ORF Transcript_9837/g.11363 Transcript_9837/m.11363 type:complete len:284 (+) Transcript_9837:77-928(+)
MDTAVLVRGVTPDLRGLHGRGAPARAPAPGRTARGVLVKQIRGEMHKTRGRVTLQCCCEQDMPTQQPRQQSRRILLQGAAAAVSLLPRLSTPPPAEASDFVSMPALKGLDYGKPQTIYPDYTLTESGLQFKDFREGEGEVASEGDQVVVDWDGYTIGYYGRIVQAKNLSKGGAFEGNDGEYLSFTIGSHQVIEGFEEAVTGMKAGTIRRIIVPPGKLSYPEDTGFKTIGPVPGSFSGKRTLDFVMVNEGAIDKTLLFDIELLGVGKNAKARRAPGKWLVDLSK